MYVCVCVCMCVCVCFGSPHQPSSGRASVHTKTKTGPFLSLQTVAVELLQKWQLLFHKWNHK